MARLDRRTALRTGVAAFASITLLAAGPRARAVDWAAHAEEEVVQIVTKDDDGSLRRTKIWLVVAGEDAFVRAGGGKWGKNAERDPDVRLLTEDEEYDLRVTFLTDDAERAVVVDAFRAKYGLPDRLLNVFRGSRPKIMRLGPRPAAD